jgi:(p)ppGpp synthase/HD superfamily hydrolase
MPLTARFDDALVYAAHLHRTQRRKGTDTPYLAHLLAVAALVLEYGGDEDEAIGALLHDAVEDQGGRRTGEEIRRRFGDRVAEIVYACSDTEHAIKPPWRARKEAYLRHLPAASPSAWLVSAADKLHNARATLADHRRVGDAVWTRFHAGCAGMLWYLRSLTDLFRTLPDPRLRPLADELHRVVCELETTTDCARA